MTLSNLMDLMNRDYDRNDPKFLQEVQLKVYQKAKETGKAEIVTRLKDNMVTNPETIGLSKTSHCLAGMEQAIKVVDAAYSMTNNFENTQARTR